MQLAARYLAARQKMDKLPKCFLLLLAASLTLQCSHAKDCYMEGMPPETTNVGEVYFLDTQADSIDLTLTCKCNINSPKWDLYNLATSEITTHYGPVQCTSNGTDCAPTTYIAQVNQSKGLYVLINRTFHLNTSAVFMCYSRTEREILVVNFNKQEEMVVPSVVVVTASPMPVTDTLTVTSTAISTTTVLSTTTVYAPPTGRETSSKAVTETATSTARQPTPTGIADPVTGLVNKVGTSTLALVPVVIVLAVVLVILVGCIIAMRVRHRERTRDLNDRIDLLSRTNETLDGSLQKLNTVPIYDRVGERRWSCSKENRPTHHHAVKNQYTRTPIVSSEDNTNTNSVVVSAV